MRILIYLMNGALAAALIASLALLGVHWQQAKEDNRSLKLQMKLMAEQSSKVTKIQQDTFAQLYKLDRNTSRIVHGTIKHAKLDQQLQAVHSEALDNSGAALFAPTVTLDQRTAARRGFDVLETNNAVLLEKLRIMNSRLLGRYELLSALPSIRPVDGWISSGYGYRTSPTSGKVDWHSGMDIAARKGSVVSASGDGVVVKAGNHGSYGTLVEIDHGQGIRTRYAHNGKLFIKKGDQVQRGQKIALVGMTGRTTGAHLHYEVIVGNKSVNPARFLNLNEFSPPVEGVDVEAAALAAASADATNQPPIGGGNEMDAKTIPTSLPALSDVTQSNGPRLDFTYSNGTKGKSLGSSMTAAQANTVAVWTSFLKSHRFAVMVGALFVILLAVVWVWRKLRLSLVAGYLFNLPFALIDRPFAQASARPRQSSVPVSYWQRAKSQTMQQSEDHHGKNKPNRNQQKRVA